MHSFATPVVHKAKAAKATLGRLRSERNKQFALLDDEESASGGIGGAAGAYPQHANSLLHADVPAGCRAAGSSDGDYVEVFGASDTDAAFATADPAPQQLGWSNPVPQYAAVTESQNVAYSMESYTVEGGQVSKGVRVRSGPSGSASVIGVILRKNCSGLVLCNGIRTADGEWAQLAEVQKMTRRHGAVGWIKPPKMSRISRDRWVRLIDHRGCPILTPMIDSRASEASG